jgi:hypothetical protein
MSTLPSNQTTDFKGATEHTGTWFPSDFEAWLLERKISRREYERRSSVQKERLLRDFMRRVPTIDIADAIIQKRSGAVPALYAGSPAPARTYEDESCGLFLDWLRREYPQTPIRTMAQFNRQPIEFRQDAWAKWRDRFTVTAGTITKGGFECSPTRTPVSIESKKSYVTTAAGARAAEARDPFARRQAVIFAVFCVAVATAPWWVPAFIAWAKPK